MPEAMWTSTPICSMYGIFTYIWVISRANVGKYSIHGAYGTGKQIHEFHGVENEKNLCNR